MLFSARLQYNSRDQLIKTTGALGNINQSEYVQFVEWCGLLQARIRGNQEAKASAI